MFEMFEDTAYRVRDDKDVCVGSGIGGSLRKISDDASVGVEKI